MGLLPAQAHRDAGTHHCAAGRHLLDPQHDFLAERGRPEDLGHEPPAARLLGSELPPTEEHLVGLEKSKGNGKAESPERLPHLLARSGLDVDNRPRS